MAKRFTDTAKWDKAWFRKLTPEMKCVWMFLCDRCDHAGVWEIDEDAVDFFVGCPITVQQMLQEFGEKIEVVGSKLVLKTFAEFQYGHLNSENRVHKSVISRLEKVTPYKGHQHPINGSTDTNTNSDAETITKKDPLVISLDALKQSIPLITLEKWQRKYPDEDWLNEQIELCYDFHSADITKMPRTSGAWMRKLITWLANNEGKQKAKPKPKAEEATNWETLATKVLESLVKRGTGTRASQEIAEDLGPELHRIVIKAGTQKIRDVQRGPFQLKTVAGMLKTASELLGASNAAV